LLKLKYLLKIKHLFKFKEKKLSDNLLTTLTPVAIYILSLSGEEEEDEEEAEE
jgi:hypothetical protein